jgi:hypothetical protein
LTTRFGSTVTTIDENGKSKGLPFETLLGSILHAFVSEYQAALERKAALDEEIERLRAQKESQ